MARCSCAGSTCSCKLTGSGGITVTGTGTAQDPYAIAIDDLDIGELLEVDDTTNVDLSLLGSGTALDPFVLSAEVQVGDTVVSTPTTGGTTEIDAAESAHVFEHETTIATHTVQLPESSESLKNEVTLFADSAITALTVSAAGSATVVGAPTTLAAGASFTMRLIGTAWRCTAVSA
jgi:hypothetical protein